MDMIGEMD